MAKIVKIFFLVYSNNLCISMGQDKGYMLIRTKEIVWLDRNSTIELCVGKNPKWIFGIYIRKERNDKKYLEIASPIEEEVIRKNPIIY